MAKKAKKTTQKAAKKGHKKAAKKASPATTKKSTHAKAKTAAMSFDEAAKAVKSARTKSEIVRILAAVGGLSKKEVQNVFEILSNLIALDLGKKGPGLFTLPGLMKITRVHKPATRARDGVNPFTKEPMRFKAKPARNVVKVRVLKALKAVVNN